MRGAVARSSRGSLNGSGLSRKDRLVEQAADPLAGAELRQDGGTAARVEVVDGVCQHRRHHGSFLGPGVPEASLEVPQHRLERAIVPLIRRRVEAKEVVKDRRIGRAWRAMPEGHVRAERLDVERAGRGRRPRAPAARAPD